MNEASLRYVVMGLGVLITALSLWGVLRPAHLAGWVRQVWDKPWSMALASGVRLVLGIAMLMVADSTRFPAAFQILGIIAIVAAVLLPVIGKQRVARMLDWMIGMPPLMMSLWCVFGVAFGLFILYSVG